jgi:lipase
MRLHLHEWGDRDAPPIVCLHGIGDHGRRFRKLAEERLAERFRVLAPDLRGHGRSGWEPPWNLTAHAGDVVETVAAARVERATWLGHSFGGRLVLELPDRLVERAVLLDPAIDLLPEVALNLAEEERKERSFASREEALAARLDSNRLFHTPREIVEEELAEHLVRSPDGRFRYRYSQGAVVAALAELAAPAPPPAPVPTLLVLGAESYLVRDDQLESLRAALGERLTEVTVPGGHSVYWDAFEITATAVFSFLAGPP